MKKENICRDGSFAVIFSGSLDNVWEMQFLLGCSKKDNLLELLGGGFNLLDGTPLDAVKRETREETNGFFQYGEFHYFCHMIQKVPSLGGNEKGNLFGFCMKVVEVEINENIEASDEHSQLYWRKLSKILIDGEKVYRTSTLRLIIHFLNYLKFGKKFRFGILADQVSFSGFQF